MGGRIAARALARGWAVRTLARREWDGPPYVPAPRRFAGHLPGVIPPDALRGATAVVHCAALAAGPEHAVRAVNVDGTLRLARMARDAGVRTFVFLSSSSASPSAPSAYGRSKAEAEGALLRLDGLRVVILRPNLVVGPGTRGLFARMRAAAGRLTILPVPGAGAPVQPVHVDDLAEAVFGAVERADALAGRILEMGDPGGTTLGALLRDLGRRRRLILPVPVFPVLVAARMAEALHAPFPFGSENLEGLRVMRKRPTADDLAALGVTLRPLADALRDRGMAEAEPGPDRRAVRVLIVGLGRMGLLHAVAASRLPGLVVAGLVDGRIGAARTVRRLGVRAPVHASVGEALAAIPRPDAAVIATESSSHLAVAGELIGAGVHVLVEKPWGVDRAGVEAFAALRARHPGMLLDGYCLPRVPAIAAWLGRLRRGELGTVKSFAAVSLLDMRGRRGWRDDPARAGGGALMAVGTHALSLLCAGLGVPEVISAQRIGGPTEDVLAARLTMSGAEGLLAASWAAPGHDMPFHAAVFRTDRGRLTLNMTGGRFEDVQGRPAALEAHSSPGFLFAAESGGAGYRRELEALRDRVRGEQSAGELSFDPLDLERLVFRIYAAASPVTALGAGFRDAAALLATPPPPPAAALPIPDIAAISGAVRRGGAAAALRALGWRGALAGGLAALPAVIRERGLTVWAATEALVAATIPRRSTGTLALDSAFVDLALAMDRPDVIARAIRRCRRAAPRARLEARTANPALLANALLLEGSVVDAVVPVAP